MQSLKERSKQAAEKSRNHFANLLNSKLTPDQRAKVDEYNAIPPNKTSQRWTDKGQGKLNWDLH
jgi:hypothetical protein